MERSREYSNVNTSASFFKGARTGSHTPTPPSGIRTKDFSTILDNVANSAFINGINSTGEWLANTPFMQAINSINPIVAGSTLLDESIQLYKQGKILNGTTAAGLSVISLVPGEAFTANSMKNAASYLGSKLSLFGRRIGSGGEKAVQTAAKHPLAGLSPENVVRLVDEIGLETPRDQLILWSGLGKGNEGVKLSQEFARANGGVTLEMTKGGKWLNEMDLFGANSPFTFKEAVKIWEGVSTKMVQQASGQVRSVIGQVRPTSIYRAEQSEILMNAKITGLDELYLKPRFTFGRN